MVVGLGLGMDLGFWIWGLGLGFRIWGLGLGLGFRIWGLGFGVWGGPTFRVGIPHRSPLPFIGSGWWWPTRSSSAPTPPAPMSPRSSMGSPQLWWRNSARPKAARGTASTTHVGHGPIAPHKALYIPIWPHMAPYGLQYPHMASHGPIWLRETKSSQGDCQHNTCGSRPHSAP